jgi:hypothetical protein
MILVTFLKNSSEGNMASEGEFDESRAARMTDLFVKAALRLKKLV